MSKKITFIGAGSQIFTRSLVRDLLTYPAFADANICLMDINPKRLEKIKKVVELIIQSGNYPATVTATTDRIEALKGADGVTCTIATHPIEVVRGDCEIPKKYGVDLNNGDTRGPGGIFRFLRTSPVILSIVRDIEKYCPGAVFLNYSNPMAMVCRLIQGVSSVTTTGLCHSVQGTSRMLADWIGVSMDDVTYVCAGINHQAFYIEYKVKGKDAYPLIRKAITTRPEIYNEEQVRNEMFLALDYYVTESSGHNSEYNAWFRKRPDLIEKYCNHGTGWNPGRSAVRPDRIIHSQDYYENEWYEQMNDWMKEPVDLNRGHEYAACIFNAMFGDNTMFEFNGNVLNNGLIDNIPQGVCVEVPCLASKRGLSPMKVGKLPPQCATLISTSANIEEMAVQASIEGDPRTIYQAICFDPLTSAVCSLAEIKQMVDEMFEFNRQYLPQFKHIT